MMKNTDLVIYIENSILDFLVDLFCSVYKCLKYIEINKITITQM